MELCCGFSGWREKNGKESKYRKQVVFDRKGKRYKIVIGVLLVFYFRAGWMDI